MSPNEEIYKAVLNIYKEAFQSGGRIEALRAAFQRNFESTVVGFTNAFKLWSREAVFKSAVRIVRSASNILDILFNTRNGLVVSSEGDIGKISGPLFKELWISLWKMLETAYRMSLPWSVNFNKEQLIEFMRDVLECSNALLRYFTGFEKIIHSEAGTVSSERQKEMDALLLNQCVTAVRSLTAWLRLNDLELLQSCVRLVCDILMRLAKSGVRINEESVAAFDKIIVNSKKKKNNLTEAQRTEIFIALSEHTDYIEIPDDDSQVSVPSRPPSAPIVIPDARTVPRTTMSVHEQMKQASARSSQLSGDKGRSISAALKSASAMSTVRQPSAQSAQARAEYLRNRAALPAALRKPAAKNVSAGAVKRDESSASESDSDSDTEGLFKINDPAAAPKIKNVQKRTVQMVDSATPLMRRPIDVRAERNRVEQNLRARTNPDLTGLHMRLLNWDPCHDSLLPPDQGEITLANMAKTYQTAHAYSAVVEPLFMLETWQHVVASRDAIKPKDKFRLTLQTRSAVDRFVDLFATIKMDLWQKYVITEPDLLLLSATDNMGKGTTGAVERCLAKVQSISKKRDFVEIALRTVPGSAMVRHLRPTVELWAAKLTSLTPTHREYATLKALPYYDLCDLIVTGRPTKPVPSHSSDLGKLMRAYAVNEPQAKAIDAALNSTGFTLIQGPPGTGKTKTILGMVGAFLSASAIHGTAISLPGQRQQTKKEEPIKRKILLCAPSNAAVDEIVLRLKSGIFDSHGKRYVPKVVRMGMSDAINVNVRDVTLDVLLDEMLMKNEENLKGKNTSGGDPAVLREKLNDTLKERDVQRALLEQARKEDRNTGEIEVEIKKLNNRKTQLGEQLDELRDKQSQRARAKDIERKRFQTQILANADIICATLSGSGHELMANVAVDFETVIIDEACQTTELSALIPLKYGCTRCIMVGDPNQLPPTVLSTEAVKYAYNESLFVRMQRNNPNAVRLLAIQYRMHSSISRFPSKQFYDGSLLDGPEVDLQTKRAWHNSTIFGTYRFFDVAGREQETASHSVFNNAEAYAAMDIYKRLRHDFFDIDFDGRIGIVTPYKEQFKVIRTLFTKEYGNSILSSIDFNTVDGFQGQEKDIIIFSCVRANPKRGIGFLADKRRMNVALTRAKSSVFILGCASALKQDAVWSALVQDAQERDLFSCVDKGTFSSPTRIGNENANSPVEVRIKDDVSSDEEGEVSSKRPLSTSHQPSKKRHKTLTGSQSGDLRPLAIKQDAQAVKMPIEIMAVKKASAAITPRGASAMQTVKTDSRAHPRPPAAAHANHEPKMPVKNKPASSLFIKRKR
ncbi:AAA domain-domain-containing protein [Protomyces lactucae-debilis]|uniref:AAA domain-domain-containing protein n=1 Tax=Protomyces lactucae-debilis TaxID=2754530 RepID=A0A1Y2FSJ2_PROLT|nr:AAA domain-containing protein [Protomyces lactucae-debilis]ORY86980.1 AAA domain-domain-containing protein [Protomyces lactucae-debilis]